MMGIRKVILPILALNLALASTAFGARTNLQIAFDACDDAGGKYVSGNGAVSSDGKEYCSEVICVKSSANVGSITFDSVVANYKSGQQNDGDAEGERGYAILAWDKNVCVPHSNPEDVARQRGEDRRRQAEEDRNRREAEISAREDRERRDAERRAEQDRRSTDRGGDSGGSVDVSVDGGIDFGPFRDGARISVGGDIYTVGSDDFYRVCMRNNRITDRCARGSVVGYDTDHTVGSDVDWQMRRNGDGKIRSAGGTRFYTYNGRTFECAYDQDPVDCLKYRYGEINARIGDIHNCVNCNSSYRISSSQSSRSGGSNLSGWAEVIGALAPIGVAGIQYAGIRNTNKTQLGIAQEYAGAQISGYENCRMMQTHYMDGAWQHMQTNELPDSELNIPECNGYSTQQYAQGNGNWNNGWGSFGNGWNSSGYGPNFQARMYGPSAGYNFGMNANSGWGNPNAGLGYNMQGNLNLGQLLGLPSINFNANANANMSPWGSSWGNNYNNNSNICLGGPCPNNGWNNGWNGNSNYNNNGWGPTGNFNANIGWNAGANGTVPWGNNNGSYQWNGNGNWNGNNNGNWNNNGSGNWGNNNGSVNGNQFWAVQNAHNSNQQSLQAGNYYQQAALNNSANQANYNASQNQNYSGYGPNYAPSNFGFQVNAGYNFGFQ